MSPKGQRTPRGAGIYTETLSQTNCQTHGWTRELSVRLQTVLFSRKSPLSLPASPSPAPLLSPAPTHLHLPLAPEKSGLWEHCILFFPIRRNKNNSNQNFGHYQLAESPLGAWEETALTGGGVRPRGAPPGLFPQCRFPQRIKRVPSPPTTLTTICEGTHTPLVAALH